MIDAYAESAHDVAALAPVWWRVPSEDRGRFYIAHRAVEDARREGLWPLAVGRPPLDGPALLVTEALDPTSWLALTGRALVVLDGSFSPSGVAQDAEAFGHLVLTTSEQCGGEPVGVPRLDWFHYSVRRPAPAHVTTVVVWFGPTDDREQSDRAFLGGYLEALPALGIVAQRDRFRVAVGGHESAVPAAIPLAAELGMAWATTMDDVLRDADVFVSDDPDRLVEFARLAGPVAVLTAPWQPAPVVAAGLGAHVDNPGRLAPVVQRALAQTAGDAVARARAAQTAYALADGHAAERAVDAIRRHVL